MAYRTRTDIDAPAERIWQVWMDVERWPEWTPTMTSLTTLETGPLRLASSTRVKQPKLPEAVWTVTALEPGRSFTWSTQTRGVRTTARHAVEPREGGGCTAATQVVQSGPLAWLATLLFGRLTRRYVEQEARSLKEYCEAGH